MATTVGMISLGCAKNQVDAEMMMFTLRQADFQLIEDPAMAEVAIVNTCGFIESAKQESIEEILELAKLKAEGRIKAIVVTGCLAERYQSQVMEQLYEVDAVIGIGANANIAQVVQQALNGEKTQSYPNKLNMPLNGGRVQSTMPHYAYLKVADGCDNRCTYCAIPLIRGKFRSRSLENLIEEANTLVKNGVKELIVIAQDTTRYGEDLYGKLMLPSLLEELCKIEKLKWIRILYCYPERVTDELLDQMAKQEKILPYMDLPLQHCNAGVLKAMNRTGDRESLCELILHIRKKIPNIVLRTTMIAGFPGETKEQFEELSQFVNDMRFERLGCFAYSKEEDTKAAVMENQIDEDEKQKRQDIIMEQQHNIMEGYCSGQVGTIKEVVVEGFDRYAGCYFGRSKADAPDVDGKVFFTTHAAKPKLGDFVMVRIQGILDLDPVGTMVE